MPWSGGRCNDTEVVVSDATDRIVRVTDTTDGIGRLAAPGFAEAALHLALDPGYSPRGAATGRDG